MVETFKKITRAELDSIKSQRTLILSINFRSRHPSMLSSIVVTTEEWKRMVNFVVDETSEAFMFRDKYLEHYGF